MESSVAPQQEPKYHHGMREVAISLEDRANELRNDAGRADLYGRSAFNRYYYASFYVARDMLAEFDPSWRSTTYASIPELLNGKVRSRIKKFQAQARKLGDSESIAICSRAISDVNELSQLLREGYAVRSTADYDPSVSITFSKNSGQFSLASVPVSTARKWVDRANQLSSVVRRAWALANEN